MKTREELDDMTKDELMAYAQETMGTDLDGRQKKSDLVDSVLRLQEGGEPGTAGPEAPGTGEPEASDGMPVITITRSSQRPVMLTVNGKRFTLPVGHPVSVPAWVLPSLEAAAGIEFTKE